MDKLGETDLSSRKKKTFLDINKNRKVFHKIIQKNVHHYILTDLKDIFFFFFGVLSIQPRVKDSNIRASWLFIYLKPPPSFAGSSTRLSSSLVKLLIPKLQVSVSGKFKVKGYQVNLLSPLKCISESSCSPCRIIQSTCPSQSLRIDIAKFPLSCRNSWG